MLLQRRAMEVVTNNITNADTSGYKKEILVAHTFDAELLRRVNDNAETAAVKLNGNNPPRVGPLNYGTQIDRLYVDHSSGSFEETGRATDIAIQGNAFFTLDTPNGERYTRAGAFLVDRDGYIIDAEGNYLLGDYGEIYVGNTDFTITSEGEIYDSDGAFADTLRLVTFEDTQTLRKQGGTDFYATSEEPIEDKNGSKIHQGYLENANVDIGREMVNMITVYRTYETNQKMLTMNDEITGKAVNDIGRLR
jgi:flagellar basal-body rod protein FlgG